MQYLYPFLISFSFIFFSELGDKTQILVLSFSSKNKAINILIGVAIGTLLSHGVAITFGSSLSSIGSDSFVSYLKFFTYLTFIIFGLIGFKNLIFKKQIDKNTSSKNSIMKFLGSLFKNYIFVVAVTIGIGEFLKELPLYLGEFFLFFK